MSTLTLCDIKPTYTFPNYGMILTNNIHSLKQNCGHKKRKAQIYCFNFYGMKESY